YQEDEEAPFPHNQTFIDAKEALLAKCRKIPSSITIGPGEVYSVVVAVGICVTVKMAFMITDDEANKTEMATLYVTRNGNKVILHEMSTDDKYSKTIERRYNKDFQLSHNRQNGHVCIFLSAGLSDKF
ncbi:hypothetical protein FRX31_016441, partial [Thalictrum thalictroides]